MIATLLSMKPFALALALAALTGCGVSRFPVVDKAAGQTITVDKSFDAPLAACPVTQCNIIVPPGTFPTSHGSEGITQSNLTITRAGQPPYDTPAAPTQLRGGTIIQPRPTF